MSKHQKGMLSHWLIPTRCLKYKKLTKPIYSYPRGPKLLEHEWRSFTISDKNKERLVPVILVVLLEYILQYYILCTITYYILKYYIL